MGHLIVPNTPPGPESFGRPPLRIFRSDTPHDIACAAIVAGTLPPGRDMLAFSTDKTGGAPGRFAERMRTMARVHPWEKVVDISGLPLAPHFVSGTPPDSTGERLRDIARSVGMLRRMLAPLCGQDFAESGEGSRTPLRADELYLTCYHHPDVQAMYGLFPAARKIYIPHGFDSLHQAEIHYYRTPLGIDGGPRRPLRDAFADFVKGRLFGRDSVLPRRMTVDAAYSFNLALPGAGAQYDLSPRLNAETMRDLFGRLPDDVRSYYEGLAGQVRERTALLLLAPYDSDRAAQDELQTQALVRLAGKMTAREGSASVLIKPHPVNSDAQVESVRAGLAQAFPELRLLVIGEHREYPIEVMLAPFSIRACGAFGSSSMRTLKKVYGTQSYCPESDLRELYSKPPYDPKMIETWIADNRGDYIAV